MIRKLLIANRGEIACRIIRTCREIGIATVVVYSDADARSLAVELADEAIHIGASPAPESYLNADKILDAARRTGADAVHPGFGFLAENAAFAQAVIDAGLVWVGPPPQAIEAMGKKRESKLLLQNIPMIPGYLGDDQSTETLTRAAQEIGFPVMLKASAGGGGKGMRAVHSVDDLPDALAGAQREAQQSFGDPTLIIEKLIVEPRHIEVQVFGDQHGTVIALGERECSIQRRHQKIVEETPSTALDDDLRARICDAAVSIARQIGYTNAGTVEFILDADKNFYFMEMNTRLQVEHPVTEEVTGLDLVRWQIAVAEGQPLPTEAVFVDGHAIEVRVYAEDPASGFLPQTGDVLRWAEVEDVRIDSGIRSGDAISAFYDPMVAKVIAWGENRTEAIRKLDNALARIQLLGLRSNVAFLRRLLMHPDHLDGKLSTAFIDQHPELLDEPTAPPPAGLIAAALAKGAGKTTYFRNNPNRAIKYTFQQGDSAYTVQLTPVGRGQYQAHVGDQTYAMMVWAQSDDEITLSLDGHRQRVTAVEGDHQVWWLHVNGAAYSVTWVDPLPLPKGAGESEAALHAPMTGKVTGVLVEVGQNVSKGQTLLTMEAMKMEHRIQAPYDGVVSSIRYSVGETVQADATLLELDRIGEPS